MGWFRKPHREDSARRNSARAPRVCRFEQMEARLMLSADPIQIGAVFTELSSTSAESQGDRFEITWVGGAQGTQLTQLKISGDINQNGILDNGDVFFDIDGSGQGVGPFFPFTISPESDIQAGDITWTLSADKTTLIMNISGWDAGEKLVFQIDVDELDSAPNSLVEGAEFQGSIITGTWTDSLGHHEVATGSAVFYDSYDNLIPAGVNVPLDSQLPPGEGTDERTAGTGFTVQQEVKPFTISGTVYHDVNLNGQHNGGPEAGISGVELSLWQWNSNTSAWEDTGLRSTTDGNGNFSFTRNVPGTYRVLETQPNGYFSTGSNAGTSGTVESVNAIKDITLLGGENSTGHKFGEALPGTLSGHVYHDADNDGVRDPGETGIGGVTIQVDPLDPAGGAPVFTVTNPDGSWSISGLDPTQSYRVTEVHPGTPWIDGKDAVGSLGGSLTGSDSITQVAFTQSGQSGQNYNFGELLPASLSGRVFSDPNNNVVFDAGDAPIAGVVLELLDANGNPTGITTTTDANGYYTFTGLTPGVAYGIREVQPAGYYDGNEVTGTAGGSLIGNDKIGGVILASNQAATGYDFGELPPASLAGYVYGDLNNNGNMEASEPRLAGVQMELLDANGNGLGIFATTNANGEYLFDNLAPDVYGVRQVAQPAGWFDGLESVGNAGGAANNPGDSITGIQLGAGVHAVNYKFGELPPASFSGFVYVDQNNNGALDGGEQRLSGVTMELLDAAGNPTGITAVTDGQGRYSFTGLAHGTYGVRQVAQPAGYFDGRESVGNAGGTANNPGDKITGLTLAPGQNAVNYNFGELPPSSLAGFVYGDLNNNGNKEASEPGIAGVTMELLDANGNGLGIFTTTDANGHYSFTNLAPGVYGVRQVAQPAGWFDGLESVGNAGGTANNPGDSITGIQLDPSINAVNYKFGELPPASLSGFVYGDMNNNGNMEASEPGIPGVTMELLDANGNGLGVFATTDANGYYSFTNLAPGVYGVRQVAQPAGWYDGLESAGNAGGTANNPGDSITGISLTPGLQAVNYKFGELPPGSISGYVFRDDNGDCHLDPGEIGLAGVKMELLDQDGNVIQTVFTKADGTYRFDNVAPGTYSIRETQPAGYFDSDDHAGSAGGVAHNPGDLITGITLGPAQHAVNYVFCEVGPGSISGYVFQDGAAVAYPNGQLPSLAALQAQRNGQFTPDDTPLGGVQLLLGDANGNLLRDSNGNAITTYTNAAGFYRFDGLAPGVYTVLQGQPSGYHDGIDTAGTTGGVAANFGNENHPALAGLNHGYNAIAWITVLGSAESQFNNFSEIAVRELPPPPQLPPELPPEVKFPAPPVPPSPFLVQQGPLHLGQQPSPVPFQNIDLYFGGSGQAAPTTYSWHLSVIDAGNPRGGNKDGDALVSVSEARLDVFTSAHKDDLKQGHFILPKEGVGEDDVLNFGRPGAIPVAGDFNGDGTTEVGVFHAGNWYIDLNGNGVWDDGDLWAKLGEAGDRPVVGDWDGDGKADIGIFGPEWPEDSRAVMSEPGLPDRQNETTGAQKNMPPRAYETSLGHRVLKRTSAGDVRTDVIDHVFYYGGKPDHPVVGDWNGDGVDTIGVFLNGTWILDDNGDGRWLPGESMLEFGQAGDIPVVGDFNGDGIDEIGVFRNGKWIIDSNGNRTMDAEDTVIEFGQAGDLPIVGDWNGDGIEEIGVYRQGVIQKPEL